MEEYEWEVCWRCSEIFEDRDMKPYCPKCLTKENEIKA
jgi:Zn finger protein HypA/HybF involved in hydrogenase expression